MINKGSTDLNGNISGIPIIYFTMLSKLIVVLLVALLSLLSLVSSQQQIMVSVKVDGEPFDVTFAPDLVTSFDVAAQLCKQNEDKFNLATLGLESCIKPLSTYFQQFVDEYNSRLSLRTSLNVDGTVFDVTYRPDLVSSQSMGSRIWFINLIHCVFLIIFLFIVMKMAKD